LQVLAPPFPILILYEAVLEIAIGEIISDEQFAFHSSKSAVLT